MANEKPSTQTQPHGDAATRKKTETSVAEAGSSAEKKVTPKNALLGLQHVLVSNVWLDPVFVAGAIGLPLALSSNMVNAIFIVSGLVTLIQATKLVRLPIVQGPSAAFDALMIAAGTAGSLAAAGTSIFISSLIFLVLCLTRVIEKLRFLFAPIVSGVIIFLVGVSLSGFTLSEFLGGAPGDKGFADPKTLAVSIITCVLVVVLSQFGKGHGEGAVVSDRTGSWHRAVSGVRHGRLLRGGLQAVARPAQVHAVWRFRFQRGDFRTVLHRLSGGHHGSPRRVSGGHGDPRHEAPGRQVRYGLAGEAAGSASPR